MKHTSRILCVIVSLWSSAARANDRADLLLADFEGKDWGDWKTTGEAFMEKPVDQAWDTGIRRSQRGVA